MTKQMALGAFLYPTGHHAAAWRHPDAQADAGVNFRHYTQVARAAEAAKFDMLFLADSAGARGEDWGALARFSTHYVAQFEPLTLLSALAAVTERIGLVATASTTYNEPYILARKFASIDHLSGGRAAWNLVTSANEAEALNFGRDRLLDHDERYRRAAEFLAVAQGLWDSWEDDAFLRDKDSGVFFDPEKVYTLDHQGEFFKVRGPLNIPRAPQGYPVLVQAGSSEAGKDLAAASAEVVFTAQQTLKDAQAFYRDVKTRTRAHGRSPDDVKIMPGIFPVGGRTEDEAKTKFAQLQNLIHPDVALSILEHRIGVPLRHLPLDGPLPKNIPLTNAAQSRQALLVELAEREGLSILQLGLRVAGARGHWQVVGTPGQVADAMEERFLNEGADGFNVMPPYLPGGLDDFIELVVPELRRRGLFRTEYEGRTLREHLGLARPARRHKHHKPSATPHASPAAA